MSADCSGKSVSSRGCDHTVKGGRRRQLGDTSARGERLLTLALVAGSAFTRRERRHEHEHGGCRALAHDRSVAGLRPTRSPGLRRPAYPDRLAALHGRAGRRLQLDPGRRGSGPGGPTPRFRRDPADAGAAGAGPADRTGRRPPGTDGRRPRSAARRPGAADDLPARLRPCRRTASGEPVLSQEGRRRRRAERGQPAGGGGVRDPARDVRPGLSAHDLDDAGGGVLPGVGR
jgi:hypothetical protein